MDDWFRHESQREKFFEDIHTLAHAVEKIAHCVCKPAIRAESATLTFKGANNMPLSIVVGQAFQAQYQEFSGAGGSGSVVPPTGAVAYASDNAAVATVDPVSGAGMGVSAGTANISANDAGLPAPGLPASDVLTVGPASVVAVSSTMTLSAGASGPAPLPAASSHKAPASKQ